MLAPASWAAAMKPGTEAGAMPAKVLVTAADGDSGIREAGGAGEPARGPDVAADGGRCSGEAGWCGSGRR
jgi:hypothetical protein